MPNKTVEIVCDEQGNYSVGEEPDQGEPQDAQGEAPQGPEAEPQMQPAKSLDDALAMAKALFLQGDEQGQQQQAESDFAKGFAGPNGPPQQEA